VVSTGTPDALASASLSPSVGWLTRPW
jgi:hypothetical protein